MLLKPFFTFACLLPLLATAQMKINITFAHPTPASGSDTIYYDVNKKLSWDNFQGEGDETSNIGAITKSGFGYSARMRSENDQEATYTISVRCFFSKSGSWVKPNKKNDYVLNHEQRHFDIACIGTCMFIKKLKEANFTTTNYKKLAREIYSKTYEWMNKYQNEYDKETNNGQAEEKQKEWNKKIDAQLKELKEYY